MNKCFGIFHKWEYSKKYVTNKRVVGLLIDYTTKCYVQDKICTKCGKTRIIEVR